MVMNLIGKYDNERQYNKLDTVSYYGRWYTLVKNAPKGTAPPDKNYWTLVY